MGMLKEFRDFAMKGNVVDMAVGVIMGTAFGKIVTVLVEKVMMPPLGAVAGKVDFKDKAYELIAKSETSPAVVIGYGEFINAVINFLIVSGCLFIVVKGMNNLKKKEAEAPPAPTEPAADIKLLTEIRDLLKAR